MTARLLVSLCAAVAVAAPAYAAFTGHAVSAGSAASAAPVFRPLNVTAPKVGGTAVEDATLAGHDGTWERRPTTLTREWLRCDAGGCVAIAGASGTHYALTREDVGAAIRLRVTARNDGGTTVATSPVGAVIAQAPDLGTPVASTAPAISGTATVDALLEADPGEWTEQPATVTYAWQRCTTAPLACTDIPGETGSTYRVEGRDAGMTIRVRVTAANRSAAGSATTTATVPVERRRYTQVLCANPDTGQGVIPDGTLPDGLAQVHPANTMTQFGGLAARARCAGTMTLSRGIALRPSAAVPATPAWNGNGGLVEYTVPADIRFEGAQLHRRLVWSASTKLIASVHRSRSSWAYASPFVERCSQLYGCHPLGVPTVSAPFSGPALTVPAGSGGWGFSASVLCEGDALGACTAGTGAGYTIYGARVSLRDLTAPGLASASGSLATGGEVGGEADLTLAASDTGSGLYRVRVRLGDETVAERVLPGVAATCADVNPANADAYEFTHRAPCPAAWSGTLRFATPDWPRGEHRLHVVVEDAGGNTVTAVKRTVTVA